MPLGRVLVVEDEPQVADMLADALTSLDDESTGALNGPDAWRLAPLYQPDVVLLDVLMPGMPGTEVLDALPLARWRGGVATPHRSFGGAHAVSVC